MREGTSYNEDEVKKSYKLTSEWSDKLAAQKYTLSIFHEYENGERRLVGQVEGDTAWGERISEHYNINEEK